MAGSVNAEIVSEKLEIRATGRVYGDVTTQSFSTEEGAFLRGKVTMEDKVDLSDLPAPTQEILKNWWEQFDSLGALGSIKVLGTRIQHEATTYFELRFAQDTVLCQAAWMDDNCLGIGRGESARKELVAQEDGSFVAYSPMFGRLPQVTFTGETLTIDNGMEKIQATRH